VLLVSFHGGKPPGVGNLAAYADDQSTIGTAMLCPPPPSGAELRGLELAPDGNLWVANGSKHQSTVAAYSWNGKVYEYVTSVVDYLTAEALWHPFDLTFGAGAAYVYVSNQDTNVVARYDYPGGSAAPAPALPANGNFLAATFVASECGELPGVRQTTPVKSGDGGLGVTCELEKGGCCKVSHSVRGVVWTNGALYVADEAGGAVRVYDGDGTYLGHEKIDSPVHLLPSNGVLFVTAKGGVYASKLDPAHPEKLQFSPVKGMPADASGLAFDSSDRLYVAARTEKKIYRFLGASKPDPCWKPLGVPDDPEFLLYVD
jgi:DNA-binding beta-propeller fold protein YncE